MKVGFIGLGKLGRDAAEVLAEKHELVGYDPNVNVPELSGTQEEACKRSKEFISNEVITYKDNKFTGDGTNLSGRFPIDAGGKGGRNIILSTGNIIGFETCGTELSTILLGQKQYLNSLYPLETPELINPETLLTIRGDDRLITYYQGDTGLIYYQISGAKAYELVGDGTFWLRNEGGDFVLLNQGLIEKTISI